MDTESWVNKLDGGKIMLSLLGMTPISYLVAEYAPPVEQSAVGTALRCGCLLTLGGVALALPVLARHHLPRNTLHTVGIASMTGLYTISLCKELLFSGDRTPKPDSEPMPVTPSTTMPTTTTVKGSGTLMNTARRYLSHVWRLLAPVQVDVIHAAYERPPLSQRVTRALESAAWIGIKIVCAPFVRHAYESMILHASSLDESSLPPLRKLLLRGALAFLWFSQVACESYAMQVVDFLPLLSGGRIVGPSFLNYPFLATSVSNFWGSRYNQQISHFLRRTCCLASQANHPVNPAAYLLTVFAVSGLLHSYVSHCAFGRGQVSSFLFFLAHGAAIILERRISLFVNQPVYKCAFLWGVMLLTFPLYPGLYTNLEFVSHNPSSSFTRQLNQRLFPGLLVSAFP